MLVILIGEYGVLAHHDERYASASVVNVSSVCSLVGQVERNGNVFPRPVVHRLLRRPLLLPGFVGLTLFHTLVFLTMAPCTGLRSLFAGYFLRSDTAV